MLIFYLQKKINIEIELPDKLKEQLERDYIAVNSEEMVRIKCVLVHEML